MYEVDDPRSTMKAKPAAAPAARRSLCTARGTEARFRGGGISALLSASPPTRAAQWRRDLVRPRPELRRRVFACAAPVRCFERRGQLDEYMLALQYPGKGVRITAGAETLDVPGFSLTILPPGDSRIEVLEDAQVLRVFSTRNYGCREPRGRMPRPMRKPIRTSRRSSPGRIRLAVSAFVPTPSTCLPKPGRFGRLFRCTTMMINMLPFEPTPRDTTKLSPHHHDDFEQGSFCIEGRSRITSAGRGRRTRATGATTTTSTARRRRSPSSRRPRSTPPRPPSPSATSSSTSSRRRAWTSRRWMAGC